MTDRLIKAGSRQDIYRVTAARLHRAAETRKLDTKQIAAGHQKLDLPACADDR